MAVAITFDDGPDATHTPKLLDLLDELAIPATFFVLGQSALRHPEILKRAATSPVGHQFGNHSWSHTNFLTLTHEQIKREIEETQALLVSLIGSSRASMLMRPPFGAVRETQIDLIQELGYRVVSWNVDSEDWKGNRAGPELAAHTNHRVADGAIVLAHDVYQASVDSMRILLPKWKGTFKLTTVAGLEIK